MTLDEAHLDIVRVTEHIAALTALLDEWTARGMNLYRSYFDAVLARLLTADGNP